eukprot:TRINITY_DN31329_c0_g1_i1.p2 TRINITY_DN31329_c0_g1~~TRINITY_DN31329_c0_g1_i1.p2  ORF type:complete len:102 (-),score=7.88 TRINITY_DN31329_c0_g1_i1:739-1002(-)
MVSGSEIKGASDMMASCLFHKYGIVIDPEGQLPNEDVGGHVLESELHKLAIRKAELDHAIVYHVSFIPKRYIPGFIKELHAIDTHKS